LISSDVRPLYIIEARERISKGSSASSSINGFVNFEQNYHSILLKSNRAGASDNVPTPTPATTPAPVAQPTGNVQQPAQTIPVPTSQASESTDSSEGGSFLILHP